MDEKERLEQVLPGEIEKRSFAIISQELGERTFDPLEEPVIKRCIHTSADFDYADNLVFSPGVMERALAAVRAGARIVTDTNMGLAGINKKVLASFGGEACCFMADPDVADLAKKEGTTRAVASMKKAAALAATEERPLILAVGNAPTALVEICGLLAKGQIDPALVIGVPVGFVNVVAAKEMLMETDAPYIVARGRKGGSNIAAAICNAILYMADQTKPASRACRT